jgi:hypothetical protein
VSLATGRGGNHNDAAFVVARGEQALRDSVSSAASIADLAGLAERFVLPAERVPAAIA